VNKNILYRTNDILVTPSMARFGAVSYQMSSISSIAVYHHARLSPFAVTLGVIAAALAAFAYFGREQFPDYSLWSAIAAPVALVLSVAWQRIRPVLEYRLVMKAAGGETETITTFDRVQVFELHQAIENAFHMPRVQIEHVERVEQVDTIRPGPRVEPRLDDDRPENGLHITRDWVVANVDLAPR
jgi:hypothetical protein